MYVCACVSTYAVDSIGNNESWYVCMHVCKRLTQTNTHKHTTHTHTHKQRHTHTQYLCEFSPRPGIGDAVADLSRHLLFEHALRGYEGLPELVVQTVPVDISNIETAP